MPATKDTLRGVIYDEVTGLIRKTFPKRIGPNALPLTEDECSKLQAEPRLQRLALELQAANDTLSNWHHSPSLPAAADAPTTLRASFQARAMAGLVEHAQRAPEPLDGTYRQGMLTVAPPGAGKTVLQALVANWAGIGLPVHEANPLRRTAVGILHSQVLIEQYLDPSETLQQFANINGRTIRVGAYYQRKRDGHDEYDLLLTTPESYVKAVERGAINTESTVRYILDEAHRIALAPTMQQHLSKFGSGLYMFTATPAIAGGRRDLRKQFPHAQFGSLKEFVQDGILSPIQLFTYRAGQEKYAADNLAVSLAADYVRNGRKTLIVCQPGNHLEQARRIADRINALYENGSIQPHPNFSYHEKQIACAVGKYEGAHTKRDLAYLRQGKRLIATTVATGQEGLDIPDLEGLIIIGPQGATWVVDQWLGRVLRPSGRPAVASEILPYDLREGKPLASIFGSFGMLNETIEAGKYFGPLAAEQRAQSTLEYPAEWARAASLGNVATKGLEEKLNEASEEDQAIDLYASPDELESSLVTGVSVREATIAPADLAKQPPQDYKPLGITPPEGVPIEWVYTMLSKQDDPNIRYVGVLEPDENGDFQYVRYYSPAAHAYLKENPVPQLVSEGEFIDEEIAELFHVSRNQIRIIIDNLEIAPLKRLSKYHRKAKYYGTEALMRIGQEIAKVPLADETDVAIADLSKEISDDFIATRLNNDKYGIKAITKRRHPAWGVIGSCLHVTEAEADALREAYTAIPLADPTRFMEYTEIAARAGVSTGTVRNRIAALEEDKPEIYWMRSKPGTIPGQYVDRSWAGAFIEYIRPERILPWEVTRAMLATYFGKSRIAIEQFFHRRPDQFETEKVSLPGISGPSVLYPMAVIADLMGSGYEPAPNVPRIDLARAALTKEDALDADRVAYSREIQKAFIPAKYLPADDTELAYYIARRTNLPTLPRVPAATPQTPPAPLPVEQPLASPEATRKQKQSIDPAKASVQNAPAQSVRSKPPQSKAVTPPAEAAEAPAKPPAKPAENTPPAARTATQKQARPADMPKNFVNIMEHLNSESFPCDPNLIPLIIRRAGVSRDNIRQVQNTWWASKSDADSLALTVANYAIAPAGTRPIKDIAAEFSTKDFVITEAEIHNLASMMLRHSTVGMDQYVGIYRIRQSDNTAGELARHYTANFAKQVVERLELMKDQKRLRALRRY